MAGLMRNRVRQPIPEPGGMNAEEASTIYMWGAAPYPQMPMPATQFATASTPLLSVDVVPSVGSVTAAPVVDRANDTQGYIATAGRIQYMTGIPQMNDPVYSSKFQPSLVGPHVNYILNAFLYRAGFPAALAAGRRSPYLSTRVDQLVTRTSGGPGPATMRQAPRFKSVQTVPRYSTMPSMYNTQSTQG